MRQADEVPPFQEFERQPGRRVSHIVLAIQQHESSHTDLLVLELLMAWRIIADGQVTVPLLKQTRNVGVMEDVNVEAHLGMLPLNSTTADGAMPGPKPGSTAMRIRPSEACARFFDVCLSDPIRSAESAGVSRQRKIPNFR